MQNYVRFRSALGISALFLAASAHAVTTVGVYAPNPNGIAIADAASNSLPNGVSLTAFRTLVSGAFAANQGGVVDFEEASGFPAISTNVVSLPITFGAAQGSTLTIARTDGGNGFNSNTNNGTNVVSGAGYLGFQLQGASLTFDKGLSAFGLTLLPRGVVRRSTLTFTLDDGTTLATSQETTNTTNAVFFGVLAPAGRTLVGVNFGEPDGFTRYDDLGFVQAVPEPGTMAALALGGLVLLRRRRK